MTQATYIKLSLLALILFIKSNDLKCQSIQSYVDIVKHHRLFVDSLIDSYYSNPATTLLHEIIHYSCLNNNIGYGSGGSADIYKAPQTKTIYQLSYTNGCDSVITERTLYFINNKIVLAIISDSAKSVTVYYRNDKYLNIDNFSLVSEKLADNILVDGYLILKGFK
ncbi:hypothetical protein [Limnovirga soli]|uniref:Uncharacterized protein n=1 Tax=Limnovirga soli TaxID=2656915 RepID=A0A8J8FH50_9BACT|nr:hypothetical protein [Limnovirga soli]NNV58031.1 hypothetical protein [Limnovirga soli]